MDDPYFITDLRTVLDEVEEMLVGKNRKYGNSVFDPINCFSKLAPIEGIRIRLDDKIKRLINQQEDDTEDTELDLLGYMIIYRIAKLRRDKKFKIAPVELVENNPRGVLDKPAKFSDYGYNEGGVP